MTKCLIFSLLLALPAWGQFVSVGGGMVFSQDLKANVSASGISPAISDFSRTHIITADAGVGFLPFLSGAVHYSFARPELFLTRGDAFNSSALLETGTHTLTLDGRVHTSDAGGFRVYGFAGGGVSRTNMSIKRLVENPFAGLSTDSATYPVFTFGGGIEQRLVPLVRLKLEVRDYLAPIPSRFFIPGGAWNRIAVIGGISIGR